MAKFFPCATVLACALVAVTAHFEVQPDTEYYILDSNKNPLTCTEQKANTHVVVKEMTGDENQQWILRLSGDRADKLEDMRYVIQPKVSDAKVSNKRLSLDAEKSGEGFMAKLFNWKNSRLWSFLEIDGNTVEIMSNRYRNSCLTSAGLDSNVLVKTCSDPASLWTLLPVQNGTTPSVGPNPANNNTSSAEPDAGVTTPASSITASG